MFWYEDEVKKLELIRKERITEPQIILYGSSTFRRWDNLKKQFDQLDILNLAFGGSTLAACCWYFNRLIKPYHPKSIIIYAGDNDLGDNRHPEEVYISFKFMIQRIGEEFGSIPVAFVSIKPSILRWNLIKSIRFTNQIIKEEIDSRKDQNLFFVEFHSHLLKPDGLCDPALFDADKLHINQKGYDILHRVLIEQIPSFFHPISISSSGT